MRVRVATTVLGLTAVTVFALPACSTHSSKTRSVSSAGVGIPANSGQETTPLSSAALEPLLLDESDLGAGYTRKPEGTTQHDDVTVLGCPALNQLGGDAATAGSLGFRRQAKASFTYTAGTSSEVSEELYSDSADKLSSSPAHPPSSTGTRPGSRQATAAR
ncbi:hypothetical protein [Streptomyces sp. NPDC001292]|uniref:hypothetical protein n=1 Tax=Streptomyces sp. NPDC001292 TaxID=3364558 RepID=UPI0036ADE6DF